MAVILVQSAAITKSRLAKGFNGDNLNINGRVVSIENADKGFKAAGAVKPPYFNVVSSGNRKGFAAGAVSAFNDYSKEVYENKYSAESIINRYFDDMDAVVDRCGIEDSHLSIGVVFVFDDCVVAAKTGGCHILRFSDGELFEIALSEDENGRGFQFVDMINDGDMFAIIGEECSSELDYDGIVTAFDNNNELKVMLRDLYSNLASGSQGKDCSAVVLKLGTDMERTFAAVPIVPGREDDSFANGEFDASDAFDPEEPIAAEDLVQTDEKVVSDSENPETGKRPSTKKKIMSFIPIMILVIILAVAAALYLATRPSNPIKSNEGESVSAGEVVVPKETESGDDFNGSNGMVVVTDDDAGGNISAGTSQTTSANQTENTTRRPSTTQTQAQTTNAPSQTTESQTTAATTETTQEATQPTTEATTQAATEPPAPTPDVPAEGEGDNAQAAEPVAEPQ